MCSNCKGQRALVSNGVPYSCPVCKGKGKVATGIKTKWLIIYLSLYNNFIYLRYLVENGLFYQFIRNFWFIWWFRYYLVFEKYPKK